MLPKIPNSPPSDSSKRDDRIHAIRQRLTPLLEQAADDMARQLAELPDQQLFGAIELALRTQAQRLAAAAHQAAIDTREKKTTITAPASSASTAATMPNSSTT